MSRKQDSKRRGRLWRQLIYFGAVVAACYLLVVFLIMPLYTRHWQRKQVPDVTFLSVTAAEKVVRGASLVPVEGEQKYDNSTPPGYVLFQNPLANAYVKKRRRVYFVVSKGKQSVSAPKLVGVNMRDAYFILMQAQLKIGKIDYEFDAYYPEEVIMAQAVEPDKEVSAGSRIDVTVSLGEEPTDVFIPGLVGRSIEDADILIKKACLVKGRVTFTPKENAILHKIIYQSPAAGLQAAKGDTINIVVSTLSPGYEDNIPW